MAKRGSHHQNPTRCPGNNTISTCFFSSFYNVDTAEEASDAMSIPDEVCLDKEYEKTMVINDAKSISHYSGAWGQPY